MSGGVGGGGPTPPPTRSPETSASPASLTARARPEARPDKRAANLLKSGTFIVVRRAVLDCNGVDPLVKLPGAFDLVKGAIEAGELELLSTPVLVEEISATPDPIRRARLQALVDLARMVPTGAFLLGEPLSPLGLARIRASPVAVEFLPMRFCEQHLQVHSIGREPAVLMEE